jgi:hypothetical protein
LRARRCPRGNGPPTGGGCASGMVPHIRVSWSGWLTKACSGWPSEGPSAPLLSRGFVLVVGTAGFEPATPCSQSQIGHDRHLQKCEAEQVDAASALSVVVRSGPVMTVVNGTLVARSPRMTPVSSCAVGYTLTVR